MDFIGRFENFQTDIYSLLNKLYITKKFNEYQNKSKRKKDYSLFYNKANMKIVEKQYKGDIDNFGYAFEDNRKVWHYLKKLI